MDRHMPVVIVTSVVCIATCVFALSSLVGNASEMDVGTFSMWIIVIPCALMVLGSFVIMATASEIGRKLFLVVAAICFVTGIISMIVTSMWLGDASVASALLANSAEGTAITVPVESPLIAMRDIAAFIVCPTVGSIAGAWVGSRLHPVKSADGTRKGGKGRKDANKGAKKKGRRS